MLSVRTRDELGALVNCTILLEVDLGVDVTEFTNAHHPLTILTVSHPNLGALHVKLAGAESARIHNLPKWEGVWAVGRLRGARIRMASARTLGGRGRFGGLSVLSGLSGFGFPHLSAGTKRTRGAKRAPSGRKHSRAHMHFTFPITGETCLAQRSPQISECPHRLRDLHFSIVT